MNSKSARAIAGLLACIALLSGTLWAESPRLCSVRGRVVNAVGEQPLKNARVQLKSAEDTRRFYNVTTDAEGQFAFTQVVPGTYRVLVRHNGFVPRVYAQKGDIFSSGGGLLTLKPGDEVNNILFRLVPTAAILGQVVDEEGEPLPGVEVQALVKSSRMPATPDALPITQGLVPIQTDITNDLGQFRLHSLPPGEYYISAVDSGMPESNDRGLIGGWSYELADPPRPEYPPTYYPGVTNPLQASKVGVRSGDEVRIEFRLGRGDMYTVSGRVLDAGRHPLQGASVSISPEDLATEFFSPRYGGETDASGRFQIAAVAPGSYSVEALKVENDKQRMAEHSITVSAEDITGLDLVLLPPVKVSGQITFEGSASLRSERGMVWLSSIADGGHRFGAGEIKKDNTFIVDNLFPGRYAISVTALAGDAYLKSAHVGTADVLKSGVRVSRATPAGTLELVVSPFGASVEGTVTKAQTPIPGAYVGVEMTNAGEGRRSVNTETQTDQYGHFAFHALPPGEYTFSVSEEEQSAGVHAIKVGLNEGQHSTVSVRLDLAE
jgi:uncharacterized GH25 family protein